MAAADAAPALSAPRGGAILARLRPVRARARPAPPPPTAPEALDFQDELERLIAEPPPPLLRGPHHLVALLLALLVGIAALTRLDMVVTGPGRLAPDAPPLVLAPMDRAVIREILVRPGDIVAAGQVLALLDPTFAGADAASLRAQRAALAAQLRRVEAEVASQPLLATTPGDAEANLQAVLHAQRQALRAARLDGFAQEIGAAEASLAALTQAEAGLEEQLGIAREVEALRARLFDERVGSRLNALAARAARLQAEQELRQNRSRQQELRHTLAARQAERQAFREDWQRQSLEDLARLRGELARAEEQLAKAARLDELTQLVAPEAGVVLEVARRSVGSVLREAEPLVTLVPLGAPLVAEIALRSADIGLLRGGDAVVVKVDAFPYQRHGTLAGTLRSVAPDSARIPEAGEGALHRGVVAFAAPRLDHLPEGTRPIPGMTVSAEIKVGSRSVLAYFLYPLLRGLQESIREP